MLKLKTTKRARINVFLGDKCPNWRRHTRCPKGYVEWSDWAEKKLLTHNQHRCPGCGLYKIWRKRG